MDELEQAAAAEAPKCRGAPHKTVDRRSCFRGGGRRGVVRMAERFTGRDPRQI